MAITGISSYDGKQIIAAGAQSATKAYQDSNGGVITSKYQTTADMSNYQTTAGMSDYQTTAGMSDYATTASVTGKQDALTFGYTDSQISQINGSAIYSQGGGGGGGYTGNVQEALNEVYSSSATWNTVTDKLDASSQVVTSTGGTTTYIQTINGLNISATNAGSAVSATNAYNLTNTAIKVASATSATNANTATYASNGIALTSTYNSARSGYAASAYINNNITANISNWNKVSYAYSMNSAQWLRPTWKGYDYYNQGLNYITANYVGSAGFRFNPGKLFTTCSIQQWTYSELELGANTYAIKFGATMNNVVGAQWSYHTGVFTLSKGNFTEVQSLPEIQTLLLPSFVTVIFAEAETAEI